MNISKNVLIIFGLFFSIGTNLYSQVRIVEGHKQAKAQGMENISQEVEVHSFEDRIFGAFNGFNTKPIGRRYLIVQNHTSAKIRVYVSYKTMFTDGSWDWSNADFTSYWELNSGKRTYLRDDDFKINAGYVKIWAEKINGSGVWVEYKEKTLTIGEGNPEQGVIGDFVFTFNP